MGVRIVGDLGIGECVGTVSRFIDIKVVCGRKRKAQNCKAANVYVSWFYSLLRTDTLWAFQSKEMYQHEEIQTETAGIYRVDQEGKVGTRNRRTDTLSEKQNSGTFSAKNLDAVCCLQATIILNETIG